MARVGMMAIGLLGLASIASADDLLVPTQFRDIQSAIDAAADGDIVIVAPGVYNGRGNTNISFRGKAITVRSSGGAAATTIDALRTGTVFIFDLDEGPDSVVEGFTITGASRSGIAITTGSPTIRSSVIVDNWNGLFGGGVNIDGAGGVTLIDCELRDNLAGQGGGLNVWNGGTATLVGCRIEGNRTDITGGGGVMADNGATLAMDRCVVVANESIGFAGSSAGVRIARSSTGTITNSLITGNTASGSGAGVSFTNDSRGSVINTTIADNNAAFAGGALLLTEGVVSVEVANTILWNNFPDQISAASTLPDVRYSIVMDGSPGEGVLDIDPLFTDRFAGEYTLQPGSPAIDASDNDAAAGLDRDLAGLPRFVDDPSTPDTGLGAPPLADMGAYELQVASCPADIDGDGRLTTFDFLEFQNLFDAGDDRADFDEDGRLTLFDFLAFQTAFDAGCD